MHLLLVLLSAALRHSWYKIQGLRRQRESSLFVGITNCSEWDFSVRFDGAAVLGTF